jgi:hypothetical protein
MLDETRHPLKKELTPEQIARAYAEAFSTCTWGRPLSGPPLLELLSAPQTLAPNLDELQAHSMPAREESPLRSSDQTPGEATS